MKKLLVFTSLFLAACASSPDSSNKEYNLISEAFGNEPRKVGFAFGHIPECLSESGLEKRPVTKALYQFVKVKYEGNSEYLSGVSEARAAIHKDPSACTHAVRNFDSFENRGVLQLKNKSYYKDAYNVGNSIGLASACMSDIKLSQTRPKLKAYFDVWDVLASDDAAFEKGKADGVADVNSYEGLKKRGTCRGVAINLERMEEHI